MLRAQRKIRHIAQSGKRAGQWVECEAKSAESCPLWIADYQNFHITDVDLYAVKKYKEHANRHLADPKAKEVHLQDITERDYVHFIEDTTDRERAYFLRKSTEMLTERERKATNRLQHVRNFTGVTRNMLLTNLKLGTSRYVDVLNYTYTPKEAETLRAFLNKAVETAIATDKTNVTEGRKALAKMLNSDSKPKVALYLKQFLGMSPKKFIGPSLQTHESKKKRIELYQSLLEDITHNVQFGTHYKNWNPVKARKIKPKHTELENVED